MEGDDDGPPGTPPGSAAAGAILRPPSADLALETTPEDDPMAEHMHLHVSPSRGEVHAHGRWHKYVKPRIGPGFQVKADAIPEVGDGLVGGGGGGEGGPADSASAASASAGAGLSRDSSAADLAAAGESAGAAAGSKQQQQRRSGRSTAGSRRGSRSSSGRSTPANNDAGKPDEQPSSGDVPAAAAAALADAAASAEGKPGQGADPDEEQEQEEQEEQYYSMPTVPAPSAFKLITHEIRKLQPREPLPLPPMGGLCVHRPQYQLAPSSSSSGTTAAAAAASTSAATASASSGGSSGANKNACFLSFARNIILEAPKWDSPAALDRTEELYKAKVEAKYAGKGGAPLSPARGSGSYYRRRGSGGSVGSTDNSPKRPRKKPGRKSKAELAAIAAAALSKAEATSAARKKVQEKKLAEAAASGGKKAAADGSNKSGRCSIADCTKFKQSKCNGMCRAHYMESLKNPLEEEEASSSEEEEEDVDMEDAEDKVEVKAPSRSRSTSPRPGSQKCNVDGCNKFKQSGCEGLCRAHFKESLEDDEETRERKKQERREQKRAAAAAEKAEQERLAAEEKAKAVAEAEAARVEAEAVEEPSVPSPVDPPVVKTEGGVGEEAVMEPMNVDNPPSDAAGAVGGDVSGDSVAVEDVSMGGPMPYLEEDERMLTYLHGRHNGDDEVARFCLLSHLSMGRAVQARRKMRKGRKREEVEGVPLSDMLYPSEIWRRRYERLFDGVSGDMRKKRRTASYPFNLHEVDPSESRRSSIGTDVDGTSSIVIDEATGSRNYDYEEELKKPWRSVLDCAEALVQRVPIERVEGSSEGMLVIPASTVTGPKPTLEELLLVLRKAHTLPRPEEVFGKRDTAVKRISACMNTIIDLAAKARNKLAALNDKVFDEDGEGIDLVELDHYLNALEQASPLILIAITTVRTMLEKAKDWEARLNRVLAGDISGIFSLEDYEVNMSDVCVLTAAERLVLEGKGLPLRPRSLVLVSKRVEKALVLRERLREMDSEKGDTMKQYSSLVREANKIDLAFPEVTALSTVHQAAEQWTDRATIALRSRLSLTELEELVETGNDMPVNLSDLLGKLRSRVDEANGWIEELKEAVPGSENLAKSSSTEFATDRLEWLGRIRDVFHDEDSDGSKTLLNLASDGSRIPVDIVELQLLQIETDARNWAIKAKKWTENKGKIDDLRDHLKRGDAIRTRVNLEKNQKGRWVLDSEDDLKAIVKSADKWYKKFRQYIEGDRRRPSTRCIVSLPLLRQIVDELNEIPANLGNPATKMKRVLGQAESWYDDHKALLGSCGVHVDGEEHDQDESGDVTMEASNNSDDAPDASDSPSKGGPSRSKKIQYDILKEAVDSALDVSLDLEEALALKKLLDDSQDWYDRAMGVAPKRNKRGTRGKKKGETSAPEKPTLENLLTLVKEAPDQLIDTTVALQRLNMQLSDIQSWRLQAQCTLRDIVNALQDLRNERKLCLGAPEALLSNSSIMALKENEEEEAGADNTSSTEGNDDSKDKSGDGAKNDTDKMDVDDAPTSNGSSQQVDPAVEPNSIHIENGESATKLGAYQLIANFLKEAKSTGIYTVEEEIAELLENVSEWLSKAAGYIAHPSKLFVKKNFKELDRFIEDGHYLLRTAESLDYSQEGNIVDDESLLSDLTMAWSSLVSDEKTRLEKLQFRRDQFKEWDEKVKEVIEEEEKRLSLDVLRDLLKQGTIYPQGAEAVKKLAEIVDKANAWAEEAEALINSSEVITLEKAKEIIDKGDALNIVCQEYRTLRNALRQARGWALRVKKMNNDESQAPINELKELIAEHNQFLVKMPEQAEQLKEMLCGYCLCRRPYDGFMVGCDSCEEWYHGPCVGLSEQQAEKCDKYVCIRCSALKQYEMCADKALFVVKKWTSPKDLQKARASENQRHQRKIREKKREQEKLTTTIEKVSQELKDLGWDKGANNAPPPAAAQVRPTPTVTSDPAAAAAAADAAFAAAASVPAPSTAEVQQVNGVLPIAAGGEAPDVAAVVADVPVAETTAQPQVENIAAAALPVSVAPTAVVEAESPAIKELRDKLEKTKESLKSGERRMEHLKKISEEIKAKEACEDSLKGFLRHWCILVRLSVLIPATEEEARAGRPQVNGCISLPMVAMSQEATKLGISELRDVKEVMNALSGMSWTLRVLSVLAKKPSIIDIKQCIDLYEKGTFRLPEEKCVRMIKSILYRAKQWQERATRALRPIPGETTPYDKSYLERLLIETKDIPFSFPEEARLANTIEDKGVRHCLCGGPSDGSFMISCDGCDKWYHAVCVKFDSNKEGEDSKWLCPPCSAKSAEADAAATAALNVAVAAGDATPASGHATRMATGTGTTASTERKAEKTTDPLLKPVAVDEWSFDDEMSPHAPNPETLWPPFGLVSSDKALKALGVSEVSAVPSLTPEVLRGVVQGSAYLKATARNLPSIPVPAAAPAAAPAVAATGDAGSTSSTVVAQNATASTATTFASTQVAAAPVPAPAPAPVASPAVTMLQQPAPVMNNFNADAILLQQLQQQQLHQQQQQQLHQQQQQQLQQVQQQLAASHGMPPGIQISQLVGNTVASPALPMQVQLAPGTVASAVLSLVNNNQLAVTGNPPPVAQQQQQQQQQQQLGIAAPAAVTAAPAVAQQEGVAFAYGAAGLSGPTTPSGNAQVTTMASGTGTSPPEGTAQVDDIDEALLSPRTKPIDEPDAAMDISTSAPLTASAPVTAAAEPRNIAEFQSVPGTSFNTTEQAAAPMDIDSSAPAAAPEPTAPSVPASGEEKLKDANEDNEVTTI